MRRAMEVSRTRRRLRAAVAFMSRRLGEHEAGAEAASSFLTWRLATLTRKQLMATSATAAPAGKVCEAVLLGLAAEVGGLQAALDALVSRSGAGLARLDGACRVAANRQQEIHRLCWEVRRSVGTSYLLVRR